MISSRGSPARRFSNKKRNYWQHEENCIVTTIINAESTFTLVTGLSHVIRRLGTITEVACFEKVAHALDYILCSDFAPPIQYTLYLLTCRFLNAARNSHSKNILYIYSYKLIN